MAGETKVQLVSTEANGKKKHKVKFRAYEVMAAYKKADGNNSGGVSNAEFENAVKMLYPDAEFDSALVDTAFQIGGNNSGEINLKEFVLAIQTVLKLAKRCGNKRVSIFSPNLAPLSLTFSPAAITIILAKLRSAASV